jgi:hypothetical protein
VTEDVPAYTERVSGAAGKTLTKHQRRMERAAVLVKMRKPQLIEELKNVKASLGLDQIYGIEPEEMTKEELINDICYWQFTYVPRGRREDNDSGQT